MFFLNKKIINKIIIVITLGQFLAISPCRGFASDATAGDKEAPRLITISEGIELTLKNNRLIKVALPDNEMAFQESLVKRSSLLPQLHILTSKTFNQYPPGAKLGSVSATTGQRDSFQFGADVYQTLFDFGKDLSNFKAAKELFQAQNAHTESVRRLATLEFITAYFDLLETEQAIIVFEKETENLVSYLNDIERLYEQGAAVKNDLLPAKVRLADTKQRLIAARNDKQQAIAHLNNILALPLGKKIQAQDILMQPPDLPDMQRAWDTAIAERPEIIFYHDQINASKFTERALAVENFPVVFADAGYSYQENQYLTHQKNMAVQLGAKINFYDGGKANAALLKERARQKQLVEKTDKLSEDIKLEVEDSFYDLKDACEKIVVAKESLEQADENVRFFRTKYNAGSANQTDVLAAIAMQTKAQMDYYSDDYKLKRSYAQLMYSMGMDLALIFEQMEKKNESAE